jgi:tetratricopeptide (TPR) repeat protein
MKRLGQWLILLAAWGWLGLALPAATPEEEFSRANQLCEQGKYAEAIARYEQLLQSGKVSPALYYNLGTAYFRAGQPGRALYALRHAERLAPRDPDIRANLASVRRAVSGREDAGPRGLEAVLGRLTLDEWGVLAAATLWLWLGVLGLGQWFPRWRASLRGAGGLLLASWLAAMACLGGAVYFQQMQRVAIVAQKDVQARLAPYDVSKPVWSLPEGAEVRVMSENQEWLEIRDDRGRAGWLKRDQVLLWPR